MASVTDILSDHGDIPANIADLQQHLGGIPLDRISMMPPPGTATVDDLRRWKYCELLDGVIVVKSSNMFKAMLSSRILYALSNWERENDDRGYVFHSVAYWFGSDVIRLPDISYVSAETWGGRRLRDVEIADFPPDLALDFVVPDNTQQEMQRKRSEYVSAGVKLIWTVDTLEHVVWETRPRLADVDSRCLGRDHALEANDLLPGFRWPIGEWFDDVEKHFAPAD